MTKKPIIGITLDNYDPNDNPDAAWYSKDYWYALRSHYTNSIVNAGGIPFPLAHDMKLVDNYANIIDGLMITGGGFDVPPAYYDAPEIHETIRLKPLRSEFETAITKMIQTQNKPILGICGGMQLLNVLYGGTLIQHIPDHNQFDAHSQNITPHKPWHDVDIEMGSKLHDIVGTSKIAVNSVHHQGADIVAGGLIVSAKAKDGMVEAIEDPNKPFVMGIQWHPEFHLQSGDTAIFNAFLKAAS